MKDRYESQNYQRRESAEQDARKKSPPSETNAEIYYYKKQIDSRTLMVIVLKDGEEVEGTIEWYDRDALKVNRTDEPNVLLLKHNIKYMFKAEDRPETPKGKK
jgi:sRNA-binding regulator protein Hfq